jgi:NADPH:quinone reductase
MKSFFLISDDHGARLECRDAPQPLAAAGQVLVKMHAAALNRGEFIHGHGLHAAGSAKACGMEGAGEIIALGAGVTSFKVGDNIMGRCAGAFSEYAVMDQREAMPAPRGLSMAEAASIPLTFLVAFDLLVLQGRIQAADWMLVNGVSSGVGVASLQMGKVLGANVIGTSGSKEKIDALKAIGLDVGIVTRSPDFFDAVMHATEGKGVSLAINTVGGGMFAENLRCLAFEGRIGIVGYVDGKLEAPVDLNALHAKRLGIFGVSNKLRSPAQRASGNAQFVQEILPAFSDGRIRPLIYRTFPLMQLPEARALMESNAQNGKIVVEMTPA